MIAGGSPAELKSRIGGDRVEVVVHDVGDPDTAAGLLRSWPDPEPERDLDRRRLSAPARDRVPLLTETVRDLDAAGVPVEDIALRQPTLDEVFLTLTDGKVSA